MEEKPKEGTILKETILSHIAKCVHLHTLDFKKKKKKITFLFFSLIVLVRSSLNKICRKEEVSAQTLPQSYRTIQSVLLSRIISCGATLIH